MPSDRSAHPHWPFFDLRITTPRLELRYPDDELLVELAELAAGGIHEVDFMPFSVPWTRQAPDVLRREYAKHHWARRAALTADDWTINLAAIVDGEVVGVQDAMAKHFAVTRTFETGSWLGRAHQGKGIGTEMRSAVLHLGFDGLGAERAETGCWEDNPASESVTRKLGYDDNGWTIGDREGHPVRMRRFHLLRPDWGTRRRDDITIEGLDPCLLLLGLAA